MESLAFTPSIPLSSRKSASPSLKPPSWKCSATSLSRATEASPSAHAAEPPLLLRTAFSLPAARPPVWLMRQAGRYMPAFRQFSDRLPFRQRSETPDIAKELSMQPYHAFHPDAVIMFSDILTPLPAMGVDFDIVKGQGPAIGGEWTTDKDLDAIQKLDLGKVQFVKQLLESLRHELKADDETALLGFIGAPFTLASYIIEGHAVKHLANVKRFMYSSSPTATSRALKSFLSHLTDAIAEYSIFQIDSGAQSISIFDSWAHHLSPAQYTDYSIPYTAEVIRKIHAARPGVPVTFFANGSAGKLDVLQQIVGVADVMGIDWNTCMKQARRVWGDNVVLQGNVDPIILAVGAEEQIREEVRRCVREGCRGGEIDGGGLIINLGHGVVQQTPEEAVRVFVDEVRSLA